MGVRVDEWDALPPEFAQPVPELGTGARLVFEIVLPRGAVPVATYGTDFYAGTPAVTRHRYGDGEGWYVVTALDQPGVDEVVRRILTRHDLPGPYADRPAVETATRVAPDGTRLLFLLGHSPEPARLITHTTTTDLLTGKRVDQGEPLVLDPFGVAILQWMRRPRPSGTPDLRKK
ncbi:beta-galactosidase GanA [Streptomyces sp. AK010]|nr:beta-galactosidase GanA [Streptomyces sp. AK010]